MLFDLVSVVFEVLVEILFVSDEIVSLSEIALSDTSVLFCNGFAFIFIPILFFFTKIDEFFLLGNNPELSDHNDTFPDFPERSTFSYKQIINFIY